MNTNHYIFKVLISVFLVFSIMGTVCFVVLQGTLLNNNYYRKVIDNNNIINYVEEDINDNFKDYSNTSGIDTEIFKKGIEKSVLNDLVKGNIDAGLDYCKGKSLEYNYLESYKFEDLESSITNFLEDYADSIGYEKGSEFEKKVDETINDTEDYIKTDVDVIKLKDLSESGLLTKIRNNYGKIKIAIGATYILTAILIIILIIVARKDIFYWLGINLFVGGVLLMIPCIYVISSKFISGFSIKIKSIFYMVTSLLQGYVNDVLIVSIILTAVGIILAAGSLIFSKNIVKSIGRKEK